MLVKKLCNLKKGEFFTIKPIEYPKSSQVWIRDFYDRTMKLYFVYRFNDISIFCTLKGDTLIYVDFIF